MAATSPSCLRRQRNILQKYYCKLSENIDAKIILPYMRDVVDSYEAQRVYAEQNSFKQNEKLLSLILKNGPNGFDYFMKALDVTYPHLASQMQQEMRQNCDLKFSSKASSTRPSSGRGSKHTKMQEQPVMAFTNHYALRRDIPVRQLEAEILSKYRLKLHKMDSSKILPLCDSLKDKYHADTINAQKTQFQKVEKLLDILIKLGPQAFEEFINALNSVDPELGLPILEELNKHELITAL